MYEHAQFRARGRKLFSRAGSENDAVPFAAIVAADLTSAARNRSPLRVEPGFLHREQEFTAG